MKRVRCSLLLLMAIACLFSACTGLSGTFVNERVDQDERNQISQLNDRLYAALGRNDIPAIKALLSDHVLRADAGKLDSLIPVVGKSCQGSGYTVHDEYYTRSLVEGVTTTLTSNDHGDNNYVFAYHALSKEMYVSLLLPKEGIDELLILVGYGKYGRKWKINFIQFGTYSVLKKTAPEYYQMAQKAYAKSNLIDAFDYMTVAKKFLNPGGENFHYQKEKEIQEFYDVLTAKLNTVHKLPIELDKIPSKPTIVDVSPEIIKEGCFPMIYYVTGVSIKDTIALEAENESVKREVKRIFKGIAEDKAYILYQALEKMPDGHSMIQHYGFIEQLKSPE